MLGLLAEESVEVSHRVHKALRFSLEEVQTGHTRNNEGRLIEEFIDLLVVMQVLVEEGVIQDPIEVEWAKQHAIDKQAKIAKYIEYSTKLGIING